LSERDVKRRRESYQECKLCLKLLIIPPRAHIIKAHTSFSLPPRKSEKINKAEMKIREKKRMGKLKNEKIKKDSSSVKKTQTIF